MLIDLWGWSQFKLFERNLGSGTWSTKGWEPLRLNRWPETKTHQQAFVTAWNLIVAQHFSEILNNPKIVFQLNFIMKPRMTS